MDDEAARGVADVLEGEAGNDRQRMASHRLEHADVAGIDDCEGFHSVMKAARVCRDVDLIAALKIF